MKGIPTKKTIISAIKQQCKEMGIKQPTIKHLTNMTVFELDEYYIHLISQPNKEYIK